MANPAFPANRGGPAAGGYTQLAPNADRIGTNEVLAAQATEQLRLAHIIEQIGAAGGAINPQIQANIDAYVQDAQRVKDAAEATAAREKSTRTLQPLTRVPAANYGLNADTGNIRMYSVKPYDGTDGEPKEVNRWIQRVLNLANTHGLTLAATLTLLLQASAGEVSDYINELRDEGNDLAEVIRALELRYGDLCLPEEAVQKCNMMKRLTNEPLAVFLDRLRYQARMAKRMIANDDERKAAIGVLIESNIRRVLPSSVRAQLEERILSRTRNGLPPFTTRELEKECQELERRRDERRLEASQFYPRPQAQMKINRRGNVRVCQSVEPSRSSDEECASSDGAEDDTGELIAEIKYQAKKYAGRGKRFDKAKILEKVQKKFVKKDAPVRPVAATATTTAQVLMNGPPLRIPEQQQQRMSIPELLARANCERGECIHCGNPGHYMKREGCPLLGKPIVDRACPVCKKGLHAADDCLRVFQKRTGAAQMIDTDDSDGLNE